MKLELKHYAAYLPHKLKYFDITQLPSVFILDTETLDGVINDSDHLGTIRLLLRPLSDLTKEIEHNGEKFVPIFEIYKLNNNLSRIEYKRLKAVLDKDFNGNYVSKSILDFKGKYNCIGIKHNELLKCSYEVIQKLLEWHFDLFGLIPHGLAVDINTLNK